MFGGRKSATFTLVRGNKFGSGGGRASRSGTGAGRATRELGCGIGGIGVFRDAIALVDECDPRCGACTTLIGAWLVGGIGGTGSLCAIPEWRLASTARPACGGDSPSTPGSADRTPMTSVLATARSVQRMALANLLECETYRARPALVSAGPASLAVPHDPSMRCSPIFL